jgi:hypothetical protein
VLRQALARAKGDTATEELLRLASGYQDREALPEVLSWVEKGAPSVRLAALQSLWRLDLQSSAIDAVLAQAFRDPDLGFVAQIPELLGYEPCPGPHTAAAIIDRLADSPTSLRDALLALLKNAQDLRAFKDRLTRGRIGHSAHATEILAKAGSLDALEDLAALAGPPFDYTQSRPFTRVPLMNDARILRLLASNGQAQAVLPRLRALLRTRDNRLIAAMGLAEAGALGEAQRAFEAILREKADDGSVLFEVVEFLEQSDAARAPLARAMVAPILRAVAHSHDNSEAFGRHVGGYLARQWRPGILQNLMTSKPRLARRSGDEDREVARAQGTIGFVLLALIDSKLRDPAVLPELLRLLDFRDASVSALAASLLADFGPAASKAAPALARLLVTSEDVWPLACAASALVALRPDYRTIAHMLSRPVRPLSPRQVIARTYVQAALGPTPTKAIKELTTFVASHTEAITSLERLSRQEAIDVALPLLEAALLKNPRPETARAVARISLDRGLPLEPPVLKKLVEIMAVPQDSVSLLPVYERLMSSEAFFEPVAIAMLKAQHRTTNVEQVAEAVRILNKLDPGHRRRIKELARDNLCLYPPLLKEFNPASDTAQPRFIDWEIWR